MFAEQLRQWGQVLGSGIELEGWGEVLGSGIELEGWGQVLGSGIELRDGPGQVLGSWIELEGWGEVLGCGIELEGWGQVLGSGMSSMRWRSGLEVGVCCQLIPCCLKYVCAHRLVYLGSLSCWKQCLSG